MGSIRHSRLAVIGALVATAPTIAAADPAPPAIAPTVATFRAPACDAVEQMAPADRARAARRSGQPPHRDMEGISELLPEGAIMANGQKMSWALHPRLAFSNEPPPGWTSIVPWGQVFLADKGNPATNARIALRHLRLFVRPKSTGIWCQMADIVTPNGGYFRTDFHDEARAAGDMRPEPDGGVSGMPIPGRFFHVFSRTRYPIPAGGLSGLYADFEARLILNDRAAPDDRGKALLLASAGTDYYATANAPGGHVGVLNVDAGIGRFKRLTSRWQAFGMSTIGTDGTSMAAQRRLASPPPASAP